MKRWRSFTLPAVSVQEAPLLCSAPVSTPSLPNSLAVGSPTAGYIVFKDTKKVIFYTNDLACDVPFATPMVYSAATATECVKMVQCVRGLVKLKRWTDTSYASKTEYDVPDFIGGYNMLMNCVDVMDQYRSNTVSYTHLTLPTIYSV